MSESALKRRFWGNFCYACHGLVLLSFTLSVSRASFTSFATWKSNIPTHMKSAPFSNAYLNPSYGCIAPAPRTLNPIHGFFTFFMKSIVICGVSAQTESFLGIGPADQ